jgi:(p)ppGpp synthase/HD superfamily hydrolase
LCGERNLDSHLIAALHDVIEDTDVDEEELTQKHFLQGREYLVKYLEILTEDKSLSRDPDGKNLPPRYVAHIKKMIGAPKEVVNLEIVDRFSDMMDLEYILKLPDEKREMRLQSKVLKVSSFAANITKGRDDYNPNCLDLFNDKLTRLKREYNIDIEPEIITP